jgi:hypothetical protein
MNRYLIESVHTSEECHHAVEQFIYYGHIINFEWGCEAGVHSAWAIVEGETESEALMTVPSLLRSKAKAIRLNRFTPERIKAYHKYDASR